MTTAVISGTNIPVIVKPDDWIVVDGREFLCRSPIPDMVGLCPDARTILDCGCGMGDFSENALQSWPNAKVYAFECVPHLCESIRGRFYGNDRFSLIQAAASNVNGATTFNQTRLALSGSILGSLTGDATEHGLNVVSKYQVPTVRMDDALSADVLDSVDVLKLDIQGAELLAMDGAFNVLNHAKVVLTEMSFQPQYANHPLADEVDAELRRYGFSFVRYYGSARPDIWADGLYVKGTF